MAMSVDDFDAVLRSFYERTELRVDSLPRREFMFSHSRRHHAFEDMDQLMDYVHDTHRSPSRTVSLGTSTLLAESHLVRRKRTPKAHSVEDGSKGFSTVDIGFDTTMTTFRTSRLTDRVGTSPSERHASSRLLDARPWCSGRRHLNPLFGTPWIPHGCLGRVIGQHVQGRENEHRELRARGPSSLERFHARLQQQVRVECKAGTVRLPSVPSRCARMGRTVRRPSLKW